MSEKSEQTIPDMFFTLRKSWGVGGENYNSLVHLVTAAYDKGLKDGAENERKRILDGTEGYERQLFIGLINYVKTQETKPDPESTPEQIPQQKSTTQTNTANNVLANALVDAHIHPDDSPNFIHVRVKVRELVKDITAALNTADKRGKQKPIDKTLLLTLVKTAFERGKANPDVHTSYLFGWQDIEEMTGELLDE